MIIMKGTLFMFLAAAAFATVFAASLPDSDDALETANLPFGLIKGNHLGSGVREFLGIPYATVPQRYAEAVDWSEKYENGARRANVYGPICPQPGMSIAVRWQGAYSEDCLLLNVWTPSVVPKKPAPVLVFIHGGAFVEGAGSSFNGSAVSSDNGVVVVTLNYRLANFGFLAFGQRMSNNGLLDQQSALRFVQRHIASFGGDVSRVLLYGESAGAMSAMFHSLMPSSRGLFTSVLAESGFPQTRSLAYAEKASAEFAGLVGCNSTNATKDMLACLRNVPLAKLLKAENAQAGNPFSSPGWSPVADGDVFPQSPSKMLLSGNFDVSLRHWVAGSNTDEGTLFVYPSNLFTLDAAGYRAFVERAVDGHGARPLNATQWKQLYHLYPANETSDNRLTASQLLGDATFICGSRFYLRHITRKIAEERVPSTRMYHFDFLRNRFCSLMPKSLGVLHGSELPYSFNQPRMNDAICNTFSAEGESLALTIGRFWSKLAGDDLDKEDASSWPLWDEDKELNILFNRSGQTEVETKRHATRCDFWESVFEYRQND